MRDFNALSFQSASDLEATIGLGRSPEESLNAKWREVTNEVAGEVAGEVAKKSRER